MKKNLFLFIIAVFFLNFQIGQTEINKANFLYNYDDSIKLQILAFENNLLPAISVKGQNKPSYSIYERMKLLNIPAVSVALIDDYKVVWAKAYGVSKSKTSDSITVSTMFQAASLSKPVTATVAMILSEKGKLSLDEPVNSVLCRWKIPDNEYTKNISITPRMILLHTSGLNVPGFNGYEISDTIPLITEILDGKQPANNDPIVPHFIPNSMWSYSGGGYIVLQLLMEEITKNSFPKLMKRSLFEPLQMNNSTFEQPLPIDKQKNVAKGHLSDNSMVKGNYHIYPEQAAAGLWTTPCDLANLIVELQKSFNGDSARLLNKTTTTKMLTRYWGDMGLGYLIRNKGENLAVTFNGGNVGYRCDFFAYLHKGKGAVIMTNSDNGQILINELYRSIANIYGWKDFIQEEIEPFEINNDRLLKLQGDYITYWPNGEEYIFSLKADKNDFYFVYKDKKYKIVAQSQDKLRIIDNGFSLDFSVNRDQKLDSIKCFLEFGNAIAIKKN